MPRQTAADRTARPGKLIEARREGLAAAGDPVSTTATGLR
jgi:hypothetical protein